MSLFDLEVFTLHVASHLVGEETIRRALSSSSNDESSKSRQLFSWRSPPLAPGNSDGVEDESSDILATDQNQHRPQEQREKDEESRNASLVFLEVIFDWHPMDSGTTATLESKSTNAQQQQQPTTRTISMHVNALLRMSQDGTGLCVGVVPSGKEVGELGVTLPDLERHFQQISIDVTSTPESILATTFANALLSLHTHTHSVGGLPPIPETTAENASLNRNRACVLKSSPGSGDVQAHIPLWYHDLQDTATWTIRQPVQTAATSLDDLSTIPAAAMSMWMRSLAPPTVAPMHIVTSASASTLTTGEPPLSANKKSISTPPPTVEKQKVKLEAPALVDLFTLFQEWRQTPVVKPVSAADPLHSHAAPEKEHGAVGFLGRESPGATTQDNVPAGGSPAEQKKVIQIKRKHGFTRIPAKKKKAGKLKFAGAD